MDQKKPKIAFFGSSLVSSYWNGAATYYRGIIKYLHRLGFDVTFYEPDAYDRQNHIDLPNPEWAKSVVYQNNLDAVSEVLEKSMESDIIIKASGVGVFDSFLEKAVLDIRSQRQVVIFWDVDAPATLNSVFSNKNSEFRNLIPKYDYILTYGGGNPVIDAYKSLQAKECIPVYNALDPETHYRVAFRPEYQCDLAFLGNRLPDREQRVFEFFIEVAGKMPRKKFLLGGSGWEDLKLPDNISYIGHVYTHQHNAFNSSPQTILNISRQSMADYGFSPATRIFEAAGAGACMITDHWTGIEEFFIPSKEIWVAKSGHDVMKLLDWLDDEEAAKTGKAALKKVLDEHSYEKRALQVSNILLASRTLSSSMTN